MSSRRPSPRHALGASARPVRIGVGGPALVGCCAMRSCALYELAWCVLAGFTVKLMWIPVFAFANFFNFRCSRRLTTPWSIHCSPVARHACPALLVRTWHGRVVTRGFPAAFVFLSVSLEATLPVRLPRQSGGLRSVLPWSSRRVHTSERGRRVNLTGSRLAANVVLDCSLNNAVCQATSRGYTCLLVGMALATWRVCQPCSRAYPLPPSRECVEDAVEKGETKALWRAARCSVCHCYFVAIRSVRCKLAAGNDDGGNNSSR